MYCNATRAGGTWGKGTKSGKDQSWSSGDIHADKQTDMHADMLITILCSPTVQVQHKELTVWLCYVF